jgi:hypothetical protein
MPAPEKTFTSGGAAGPPGAVAMESETLDARLAFAPPATGEALP